MKFYQLMLSNIPGDYQSSQTGIEAMTDFDMVEVQAEMHETRTNLAGAPFAPDGGTPWAWLASRGVEVWAYFDAAWPDPDYTKLSAIREHENDAMWLRKLHTFAVRDNPWWQLPSYNSNQPLRFATDASNAEYRDFVVDLLLSTGIPRFRFDDGQLYRKSDECNAGWFEVYDRLRAAGVKVIVNGAWNMADPHADTWTYPAIEHVDGCMVEHWAGHRDGMSTTSGWWSLSEGSFQSMAHEWTAAGKAVLELVRYRASDDTIFTRYNEFALHYVDSAEDAGAVMTPAKDNYFTSAWLDWFADYQVPETFEEMTIRLAEESQLISLSAYSALQKTMVADGFTPVGPEVKYIYSDIEYVVQKGDPLSLYSDGTQPDPRAYHVPVDHWEHVGWYPISRS